MGGLDEYVRSILQQGDEFSDIMRAETAPTLYHVPSGFSESPIDVLDDGMNGVAAARIPTNHLVFVHSVAGDPHIDNPREHAESLVHRLAEQAACLGAIPLALSDVADVSKLEKELAQAAGSGLRDGAEHYGVAVLNGESAGLGSRVVGELNIMGTMISIRPKARGLPESRRFAVAAFDPEGKAVWMNSDGGGTVFELYERAAELKMEKELIWALNTYGLDFVLALGLIDTGAMLLDDTVRLGARAKIVSVVAETKGDIDVNRLTEAAATIGWEQGIEYILEPHAAPHRWRGHNEAASAYNISGTSVSVIDEERLRNPPRPRVGNILLAVRSLYANRRSNGISDLRKAAMKLYGPEWHRTDEGKALLQYLLRPSTIFYNVFHELLDAGAADAVFHMSGGALEAKLAKPLAKEGLYVRVRGLFMPHPIHLALTAAIGTTEYNARRKTPFGTEAYVATSNPEAAERILAENGFESRRVDVERLIESTRGCTGVRVMDPLTRKKPLYYSGKAA